MRENHHLQKIQLLECCWPLKKLEMENTTRFVIFIINNQSACIFRVTRTHVVALCVSMYVHVHVCVCLSVYHQ